MTFKSSHNVKDQPPNTVTNNGPSSPTIKALQLKIFQDFCKLNEKEKNNKLTGLPFHLARASSKKSQRTIPMVERNAMLNEWNYIISELKRK